MDINQKNENSKGDLTSQKTQSRTKKVVRRYWNSEEFMENEREREEVSHTEDAERKGSASSGRKA